jgi:hypothetical protein
MEDMMSFKNHWAWLLPALVALSCTPKTVAEPTASGGEQGVTAAAPASGSTTPAPSASAPAQAPKVVPVANNTAGSTPPPVETPTLRPGIETPVVLPAPAILDAVQAVQGKLDPLAASVPGARVRFVDCAQAGACSTRVEAPSLTALRDLLAALSRQQGGIAFVAREQLDAYAGRSFVADVTLGGAETRAVPADENELLAPSGS